MHVTTTPTLASVADLGPTINSKPYSPPHQSWVLTLTKKGPPKEFSLSVLELEDLERYLDPDVNADGEDNNQVSKHAHKSPHKEGPTHLHP